MSLTADQLRHEALMQRLATDLLKTKIYPSLDAAYKDIRAILLDAEQIGSPTALNRINKAVKAALLEQFNPAWQDVTKEYQKLAVYEASYYAELIGKWNDVELEVPGSKSILDYVNSALMVLGEGERVKVGAWAEFVNTAADEYVQQYQNLIKAGYVKGATVQQTARALKVFNDGLARQQAEALARTGLMHHANSARRAMANDNSDILDREYPLVMFDNRRSEICTSVYVKHKDGWPLNESPIGYPPYHFRCRTSIIYGVKGTGAPKSFMPAIGAGSEYPQYSKDKPVYKGRKDIGKFEIEKVRYGTDLDAWMKEQGFDFVADNIGVTKAKLLFDGKMSLSQMSDVYGKPLTLKELRERDAEAFKRAGI